MSSLSQRRDLAMRRSKQLERVRTNGWDGHWKQLETNLLPRRGRFDASQRNRGGERNQHIIDSAGTWALRTLAAGMMAGMTSPARPWFKLSLPDKDLAENMQVKRWLDDCTKTLQRIFTKSNTYNTLHGMYRELGGFGTGLSILENDFQTVIHHNPMTVGQYALGTNHKGDVDKFTREFELTIEEAIGWFGWESMSKSGQNAYNQGNYDYKVVVRHLMVPNPDRDPGKVDKLNMAFRSEYWDARETDNGRWGLLRQGGTRFFRALAPRWDLIWGDTYGSSPGMEALGDLLQLQQDQRQKAKAIDYQVDPPLQVPTQLRNGGDFLPGGVSYYDAMAPQGGVRTAFEVNLDPNLVLEDIRDVRERINRAFYADMFLMIAQADKSMTATEVAERQEEKLLMLGPVLERLHTELLDPLVSHTFARALEANILPPAPEELSGAELQVEFVSMLAQAQKAIEVNAVDRLVGHIGVLAQAGKVDAIDKLDTDKSVERYADHLGVDPDLIVSGDEVALLRQQRAQQQQAAQAAENADKMAGAVGKLGGVPTGAGPSDNAGADLLNLFSGYNSPSAVEV